MKNVLQVLRYIPKVRRYIILLTALNLLGAAIGAIQPYAFKIIIDSLVKITTSPQAEASFATVTIGLGLLAFVRIANTIFSYVNNVQSSNVFYLILNGLRNAVFSQITALSIEYFEKEKVGAISQRYNSTTSEVARWTYASLSGLLPQIMTVIVALVILFITDVAVGAIALVAIVMFFSTQIPTLKKLRPLLKKSQKEQEKASAYLNETVSHIATVRSFGGELGALRKQQKALSNFRNLRMTREKRLQFNIGIRQTIYTLMIVSSIALITRGVAAGEHTAGDILLVALYLQQIQGSLWPIGRMLIDTTEVDASAERIVKMLGTKSTVIDQPGAKSLSQLKTIEFKNVSFSYPGKEDDAIEKVSFKLEPGQTLALVGPSGTGKTTVTKLMLRFYEPTGGQILLNGQPIENFTQNSIRHHIGMVMQDVALFNDTIEANLQLANPKATKDQVKQAASQAHADVFIDSLPKRYKTLVGERGIKLSGGEKQRVAIARAILKDPQLIILDEATSALDSESERHVQEGLSELLGGRTAVIIAHRLSTVMRADKILVLRDGKVIESGTHNQLVSKNSGLYSRLFKLQTEGAFKA